VAGANVIDTRNCTARGIVTAIGRGHIDVEFDAPPRCAGCSGACAWYRLADTRHLTLATPLAPPVGTSVTVSLAERHLLLAALLVYGLPLVVMLGGALLGWASAGTDFGTVAGAAIALAGAFLVARPLRRRVERAMLGSLVVTPSD
jgi:sigma-E factor negative regulatory protein RseC